MLYGVSLGFLLGIEELHDLREFLIRCIKLFLSPVKHFFEYVLYLREFPIEFTSFAGLVRLNVYLRGIVKKEL